MRPNRKEFIVGSPPPPCPERPCYPTCTEMCEEVLMWADQDYVGRTSNIQLENGNPDKSTLSDRGHVDFLDSMNIYMGRTLPYPDSDKSVSSWKHIERLRLSDKMTRFIYSYYVEGRRIRDIAINEGITSQAVDVRRNQAKISIRNKLEHEDVWRAFSDKIDFSSIEQYDSMILFFKYHLPRRVISNILGINSSRKMKDISIDVNNLLEMHSELKEGNNS